ncbi:MAG: hypothetical protein LDL16_09680 [Thiobacillus sp.]|nr:hypothetical protein [Thiobacillus sp.]
MQWHNRMLERPLDSVQFVVKNANMQVELLKQHRQRLPNGGLVEMKIRKPAIKKRWAGRCSRLITVG